MPDSLNYASDDVVIKYEIKGTDRKYRYTHILVGFIRALAETMKENIIVTASAYEQSFCFIGTLPVNSESIDNKYLKKVNKLVGKKKNFCSGFSKISF